MSNDIQTQDRNDIQARNRNAAQPEISIFNALLLPFLSLLAPKLAEYILTFIGPRFGKLIIRRFVSF